MLQFRRLSWLARGPGRDADLLALVRSQPRIELFDKIMNPHKAEPIDWQVAVFTRARERLSTLVMPDDEDGDVLGDAPPSSVQPTFASVLQTYKAENNNQEAFICPEVVNSLVQRVQTDDGLCYIHAPVVLQHYLVAKSQAAAAAASKTNNKVGMIDIAKLIRGHFSPDELIAHVMFDKNGFSYELLERILLPGTQFGSTGLKKLNAIDSALLNQYGPQLLLQFRVHEPFLNGDQLVFTSADVQPHNGKPKGQFVGLHALLIVGTRVQQLEDGGRRLFLLQNWWARKQFIEVDEAYLKATRATPVYVKTAQTEIPPEFLTTTASYAETWLDLEELNQDDFGEPDT